MVGGTAALPASPKEAPTLARKRTPESNEKQQAVFVELFAGTGVLTKAVANLGVHTETPNEFEAGGTDFRERKQVEALQEHLHGLASQFHHMVLHLAPPCATFSRARDRSTRTRLRSKFYPEGIPGKTQGTREANLIARRAYRLACWAADELGAKVTMENPWRSYLWTYLKKMKGAESEVVDVHLTPCMYGAPFQKPTTIRCWNWRPKQLDKYCKLVDGEFTCGRSREQGHEVLEFGGKPTGEAAEYHEGLCKAWALAVLEATSADARPEVSLDTVDLVGQGKVKRHRSRGEDEESAKERRDREDQESRASLKRPSLRKDKLCLGEQLIGSLPILLEG